MNTRCYLVLVSLCFAVISFGQVTTTTLDQLDRKSKKKYKCALKELAKGKKDQGIAKLEEVVAKYPNFEKGLEKLSGLYLDQGDNEKAIVALEALQNSSSLLDPRAAISLSYPYEETQQFDKAMAAIQSALDNPKLTAQQRTKVQRRYDELVFRKEAYANPVSFEPIKFSDKINTADGEFHPVFTADGATMLYVKVAQGPGMNEDLYMTQAAGDDYTNGMPLSEINTRGQEGAFTLSQDGKVLIFTACDRRDAVGGCDLYVSFKKGDSWSEAHNMGTIINSRFWDSAPTLSADGRTLYYSSKRKGGQGGSDIWMTQLDKTNRWLQPVNLGPKINTAANEEAPFIHPDNKSLYFISNGHIGMGSYDIFLSQLTGDSWSEPENLGYPINTAQREGGIFVNLAGTKAYYSSNMDVKGSGDIFHFELPQELQPELVTYLDVEIRDAETNKVISAKVNIIDLTDQANGGQTINTDGQLLTTVNPGNYALNVSKEGYLFHSENMQLDQQKSSSDPFVYKVLLQPIPTAAIVAEEPKPVVLNNIFFETGSAVLLSSSDAEILKLSELMNENADIRIKIIGHTDNVGRDIDNKKLSEQRAQSVYDRLIQAGIASSRLAYEGQGELVPIATNDTAEGRQKNRRTEFVILN